ncbi:hypothetical protein MIND_00798900 [Mycena indigotica]|uniref:Uncharacterized protein n=1 Tax=Mycena indigotica TaxID=2126181 RepID=A0A8H6SGH8_9AGAR|nr:uncharacterized protein MIND_00798900 [Mycena indigotica]KAF7298523.1 hypothetical protein MIND_00798900 [Mycena indigotica]
MLSLHMDPLVDEQQDMEARSDDAMEKITTSGSYSGSTTPTSSTGTGTTTMSNEGDGARLGYKGKALRSWAQLPAELIRLIASCCLKLLAETGTLPMNWTPPYSHPHRQPGYSERQVYIIARDHRQLEALMRISPKWCIAIEEHHFWRSAIKLFDPFNVFAAYAWAIPPNPHSNSTSSAGVPATPYRHFYGIYSNSCLPCRINAPHTNTGVGVGRKVFDTARLGPIYVCKEHHGPRRRRWCEVCLKDIEMLRHYRREAAYAAQEELARADQRVDAVRRWGNEDLNAAQAARKDAYTRYQHAQKALEEAHSSLLETRVSDLLEEEDESSFVFGCAFSVCKQCRAEWVWRCAVLNTGIARDREAIEKGQPLANDVEPLDWSAPSDSYEPAKTLGLGQRIGVFNPTDSVVRDSLRTYLEFGEGSLVSVLQMAEERGWLRGQTKWSEMMGMVLATRGWDGEENDIEPVRARSPSPEALPPNAVSGTYGPTDEVENAKRDYSQPGQWAGKTIALQQAYRRSLSLSPTEDDDFSDEDIDLEVEEELNVRDLALGDWARGRILDGSWVTPLDIYYLVKVKRIEHPDTGIRATHPVPWSITSSPSEASSKDLSPLDPVPEEVHPGLPGPPIPNPVLADLAHAAHVRQLRTLLLPPMKNVVRRLVMECALDACEAEAENEKKRVVISDPAIRATRITLEEVIKELREEEGVWFDGVDWSERRRNLRAEAEGLEDRSPTLSTSTLATTDLEKSSITIAVDPVRNPPKLLHSIPYVPETIEHLPPYSQDILRSVWREACAPLYHCRCTICVRAAQEQARAADALIAQTTQQVIAPTSDNATAKERREWADREHANNDTENGPFVVQIPEEEQEHGVETVISVVSDDNVYEDNEQQDGEFLDRDAPLWDEALQYAAELSEDEERSSLDSFTDYEHEDYAAQTKPRLMLRSVSRKRSFEEEATTAPKRARTKEPPVIKIPPGASPVKRRSEELEPDEESDPRTWSDGSGETKRARRT